MEKLLRSSLLRINATLQQKCLLHDTCGRPSQAVAAASTENPVSTKPLHEIPGFKSFPFVGTSWVFYPVVGKFDRAKPYLYDSEKYKRFGEISRDVFGGKTVVNLFSERDIETFLRAESKYPVRGFLQSFQMYRETRKEWFKTSGVLLTNGKEWFDLRFKLQRHMMKPREIDQYLDLTNAVSRDFVRCMSRVRDKNNEVEDLTDYLFRWSFEAVALLALKQRFGCLDENLSSNSDAQKIIHSVKMAFDCLNNLEPIAGQGLTLWKYFPTPVWRKFVKAMDCFSEIAYQRVQKSMESLKTKCSEHEDLSLLQSMLASRDIEPYEAMTMVIDVLMAGVDTTSNAMGYLLYHLAKNPTKQEKLRAEISQLLPSPSDELTPEKLHEMRYLKLCLKEALRLNSVARLLVRELPCDLVLSGYHVPAGTTVAAMMQVCCRLDKYFHNADQFLPERWEGKDKPSPFLHVPFGFGTRSCIGRRIAEIEMWSLAVEIIRNYKVEYRQESLETVSRMATVIQPPAKFAFIDR